MTPPEIHRLSLTLARLNGDLLNLASNVSHPDQRFVVLTIVREMQHVLAGFVQDQTSNRIILDPYDREDDDDL